MDYIFSFLAGVIAFVSPCILPMLPIYVAYFAGDSQQTTGKTLRNALGFVLGFALVYVALGALSGLMGQLLNTYRTVTDIVLGAIVVVFGLNYMGVLKLPFFGGLGAAKKDRDMGFFSAILFGLIFSIPGLSCAAPTLGTALTLAAQEGTMFKGVLMLLVYSLGLGLPIVISAVLIDKLKGAFNFIKRHYTVINYICGGLLILIGILMATGVLNNLLRSLA